MGVDAVAENDVAVGTWDHRPACGPVLFHTVADCRPLETAWSLLDSTGAERAQRQHFRPEQLTADTLCMAHGCFDVLFHDQGRMDGVRRLRHDRGILHSICSGWGGRPGDGPVAAFGSAASLSFCLPKVGLSGCTDGEACNFNPAAELEDGSCDYACPDPTCPGDLDGDGIHGATDILSILSEFGCTNGCTRDITGDGAVSANDILSLLALYGTFCSE